MNGELHEECGLFGIFSVDGADVVEDTYLALYALQHRGQESAGIAVNDGGVITAFKDTGVISEVFNNDRLRRLGTGQIAVGHVRYAPSSELDRASAQPLVMRYVKGAVAIGHNGALVNGYQLRKKLEEGGAVFQTNCDAEVIAMLIARSRLEAGSAEKAVVKAMSDLEGAYSIVMMSPRKLIAARDPMGFRPLSIGRIGNDWVIASETCAFDCLGAEYIRDIEPGEVVCIDKDGIHSDRTCCGGKHAFCVFEYVYFARPDSFVQGQSVHMARQKMGAMLAKEHPVDADIVCGVPDSGIDAAIGYANESGIPYATALIKNKYIGRTFIQDTQKKRERAVRIKLNALSAAIKGKRVVLIDDSIVRGTTCAHIVKMIRDAGAKEVHMRISSPPFLNPCYYGTDISSRDSLIACKMDLEGVRKAINADTLGYLSIDGLRAVAADSDIDMCEACFTGEYPTAVYEEHPKDIYGQKIIDD